jgi:hypothetical protein
VSMMDWRTSKPNARYWVLRLIHDHCHPGDKLVKTEPGNADFAAQAFIAPEGRELLLVNKRNRTVRIALPKGLTVDSAQVVDEATGEGPARMAAVTGGVVELAPFAVMVARVG